MRLGPVLACVFGAVLCACGPGLTENIRLGTIKATLSQGEYGHGDTIGVKLRNASGEPLMMFNCPIRIEYRSADGWALATDDPWAACMNDVSREAVRFPVLDGQEFAVLSWRIRDPMPLGEYRARISVYMPRDESTLTITSPVFMISDYVRAWNK